MRLRFSFHVVSGVVVILFAALGLAHTNAVRADSEPQPQSTLAPAPPLQMRDFDTFRKRGSGSIVGYADFRTKLEGVQRFDHVTIRLICDNAYSEWMLSAYRDLWFARGRPTIDDAIVGIEKVMKTGDDGKYEFDRLPAGTYLVFGGIDLGTYSKWAYESFPYDGYDENVQPVKVTMPRIGYTHAQIDSLYGVQRVVVTDGQVTVPPFATVDEEISVARTGLLTLFSEPPAPKVAAASLAPFAASGTGTLRGRVSLIFGRNEKVKTVSDNVVDLWPWTPYAQWLVDWEIREGTAGTFRPASAVEDPVFAASVRHTRTDKNGLFEFDNLPALGYIVHVEAKSEDDDHLLYRSDSGPRGHIDPFDGNYKEEPSHATYSRIDTYCKQYGIVIGSGVVRAGQTVSVPVADIGSDTHCK